MSCRHFCRKKSTKPYSINTYIPFSMESPPITPIDLDLLHCTHVKYSTVQQKGKGRKQKGYYKKTEESASSYPPKELPALSVSIIRLRFRLFFLFFSDSTLLGHWFRHRSWSRLRLKLRFAGLCWFRLYLFRDCRCWCWWRGWSCS